jgi:hypothetical protein
MLLFAKFLSPKGAPYHAQIQCPAIGADCGPRQEPTACRAGD